MVSGGGKVLADVTSVSPWLSQVITHILIVIAAVTNT